MPAGAVAPEIVIVVGTGQAGFQAAASLRDNGFQGRICLIGDEPGLPYQRPPLSKAYLSGATTRVSLDLRPAEFFNKNAIEIISGEQVMRIDRDARAVHTASGRLHSYDHLIIATGTRNRTLDIPGHDLSGVFQLRTVAEADRLRPHLVDAKRIAVIGAGFIGLEVAAVAASTGKDVTVIEAAGRVMSRAVTEPISAFFEATHQRNNIKFLFETLATEIHGAQGSVDSIYTQSGQMIAADLVLIGVGVLANSELAGEAGLAVTNSIVVDEFLQTADPAISAIGDCAAFPHPLADGATIRIESVQNATDQARCVAARLTGKAQPYQAVPWFWSDQGPLKLQIAGLSSPHDLAVMRGDPVTGAFSMFCFRNNRLFGVESVNKPADHMIARRLLASNVTLTPDEAADLGFDLKARVSASSQAAA